jgi:phosphohistidine phosphatase
MRRLLMLRHAEAARSIPGAPDRERPLTARGRQEAATIGAYIARHALRPDRVLHSHALRAAATWKHAAAEFKQAPPAEAREELYNAIAQDIVAVIKDIAPDVHTALVIGHNPGLHEAALMLIASGDVDARERLREGIPTCGLLIIEFAFDAWTRLHAHSGRLERFVTVQRIGQAARSAASRRESDDL